MAKKGSRPPQIKADDYIKVEADEGWLHCSIDKDFYDKEFYRIIDSFVLHSPCRVSSYSPKTIESFGWKNPWLSSRFRGAFDDIPGFVEGKTFFFHEAKNHMVEMWDKIGITDFGKNSGKEYAVLVYAGESNPRMDLLHHIRNAFAHGRFAIKKDHGEYYIIFEDVGTINKLPGLYVMARICLKKNTLIQWIDLFERKSDVAKELHSLYSEDGNM